MPKAVKGQSDTMRDAAGSEPHTRIGRMACTSWPPREPNCPTSTACDLSISSLSVCTSYRVCGSRPLGEAGAQILVHLITVGEQVWQEAIVTFGPVASCIPLCFVSCQGRRPPGVLRWVPSSLLRD